MKKIGLLLLCFLANNAWATWQFQAGIAPRFSHSNSMREPCDLKGGRVAGRYLIPRFDLKDIQTFVEVSGAVYSSGVEGYNQHQYVLGVAPVIRLTITKPTISPYIEVSIGAAFLSEREFGFRKLGSSVLFQDSVGVGLDFQQRFFAAIHVVHYSNAGFFKDNMGITVPFVFSVGANLNG